MVMVWFGNVKLFKKVEFPTALILYVYVQYVISEKIRKKAWWQHHQTQLSMATG
jgi:hypothetical protein